jgi:[histone H3]-trimethyl-L-lysine4 demethylase
MNEAVNFAPSDWEEYGRACVERYSEYKKMPVFSHDELLVTAALHDSSIKTARWYSHIKSY